MGSAFDAVFDRCAVPAHFDFNGEPVTYTPYGGATATAIMAVVRWAEGVGEMARPDGRVFRIEAELDVKLSDCPNLRAGDKFTIDGVDYRVNRMPRRTRNTATVQVLAIDLREKGNKDRYLPTGG